MQESENELVVAAAKPPATFREIHPDLSLLHANRNFTIKAWSAAALAAIVSCLTAFWDWRAGVVVFLAFVYVIRFILTSGKGNREYLRYASWIFATESARSEELTLSEKFVSEKSRRYFVTIKNEKGEELYDVLASSSTPAESEAPIVASVFRDPRNGLAVVATVGDTRVWLRQYLPF